MVLNKDSGVIPLQLHTPEHRLPSLNRCKRDRKGFSSNSLTQHFADLYSAVGFDGTTSHSGRRTFATNIASQGVGLRVLMRLMGHRNPAVTAVYIDASDDMLRRAVELV